jgi:hypothetical protein
MVAKQQSSIGVYKYILRLLKIYWNLEFICKTYNSNDYFKILQYFSMIRLVNALIVIRISK